MMKGMRFALVVLVAAFVGTGAYAFHDEGVAHCNGCHTMHNSQNDAAMNFDPAGTGPGTLPGTGYNDLLLFANKTDVCLRCHDGGGSYHVWSDDPLAPDPGSTNRGGGDFVFLEEDNINDAHAGAANPVLGHAAGHSVVSAMKGTVADPVLSTSPGGDYPSVDMACTSCHDPHGTEAHRLTYMTGQTTTSDTGHVINWTATMDAAGISVFAGAETNGFHNAYNSGYSEWCASCHGDFHAASASLIHPSGELLDTRQVQVYNAYRGTSDCIANPPAVGTPCGSGTFVDAYLHEVPIEDAGILPFTTSGATDGTSKVACVSCHRAHATSAMDAGRWDFNVTGLDEDGAESTSYPIPNPYDEFQRSLCNKCHAQDEYDGLHAFTP
jgi:predicted CXXCH cytochrome family protein